MIMRKAAMTDATQVTLSGGLLVGRSSQAVCDACRHRSGMTGDGADPGCHPRLSSKSYDKTSPFGPSVGLASPMFALDFTVGPGGWLRLAGRSGQPKLGALLQTLVKRWSIQELQTLVTSAVPTPSSLPPTLERILCM